MRITIDIDDSTNRAVIGGTELSASQDTSLTPPAELVARAAALGAQSAGPAPVAPIDAAPPPFTPDPATPALGGQTPRENVGDIGADQAAGAAPAAPGDGAPSRSRRAQ